MDLKARRKASPHAPTVLAIQHVRCETPGKIQEVLKQQGISTKIVRLFEGQTIPSNWVDIGGLVIMGGPMGVYEQDRHPFLRQEIRLIEEATEKRNAGSCHLLGSQLLASRWARG